MRLLFGPVGRDCRARVVGELGLRTAAIRVVEGRRRKLSRRALPIPGGGRSE